MQNLRFTILDLRLNRTSAPKLNIKDEHKLESVVNVGKFKKNEYRTRINDLRFLIYNYF